MVKQVVVPPALAIEFEAILRAAMQSDPDVVNWRFNGTAVDGVTPGRLELKTWTPERLTMIQFASAVTARRATRWDGRLVRPHMEEWRQGLRQQFALRCGIEVGAGWADLVATTLALGGTGPEVVQVKEKFGALRAYNSGEFGPYAEWLSTCTCEVCGAPGTLRRGSWYSTRCDLHVGASSW
jgi:hypothetical protein